MRVFVTGGTGFIGSAIVQELLGAGHQIVGLVRSEASARSLRAVGAESHHGALEDLDSLRRGANASDGVIHAAFIHDFSNYVEAGETDRRAVEALGEALLGTHRPLIVTSATTVLRPGKLGTEADEAVPGSTSAPRVASEAATLKLASQGVRASVLRLPPSVHGAGDRAFVPALIAIARDIGVSAYIGDGLNRWPTVHRLDAAHLFRLVLENGIAGHRYHGVADEGVRVRDIAEVIGRRLNVPVVAKAPEEALDHFGWMGHFLSSDVPTSGAQTQESLGWQPTQASLLADLEGESYFD